MRGLNLRNRGLSFSRKIDTNAGVPLEEFQGLINQTENVSDSLQADYLANREKADLIDIATNNARVLEGDGAIKQGIVDKVKGSLGSIRDSGDYEHAGSQVSQLVREVSTDQAFNAAIENYNRVEEERKSANQLKMKGINPLFFSDPKKFTTYDEDGNVRYYESGLEAQLNYDDEKQRIWSEVAADAVNNSQLTQAEHNQLRQGSWKGISPEKIKGLLDEAERRYMTTPAGQQEVRKRQIIDEEENYQQGLTQSVLDVGMMKVFGIQDFTFKDDQLGIYQAKKQAAEDAAIINSTQTSMKIYQSGGKFQNAADFTQAKRNIEQGVQASINTFNRELDQLYRQADVTKPKGMTYETIASAKNPDGTFNLQRDDLVIDGVNYSDVFMEMYLEVEGAKTQLESLRDYEQEMLRKAGVTNMSTEESLSLINKADKAGQEAINNLKNTQGKLGTRAIEPTDEEKQRAYEYAYNNTIKQNPKYARFNELIELDGRGAIVNGITTRFGDVGSDEKDLNNEAAQYIEFFIGNNSEGNPSGVGIADFPVRSSQSKDPLTGDALKELNGKYDIEFIGFRFDPDETNGYVYDFRYVNKNAKSAEDYYKSEPLEVDAPANITEKLMRAGMINEADKGLLNDIKGVKGSINQKNTFGNQFSRYLHLEEDEKKQFSTLQQQYNTETNSTKRKQIADKMNNLGTVYNFSFEVEYNTSTDEGVDRSNYRAYIPKEDGTVKAVNFDNYIDLSNFYKKYVKLQLDNLE